MTELDEEGHLTFADNGSTLPGLCHCARNEAHYADEDGPKFAEFAATHMTLCGSGLFLLSDRVECAADHCRAVFVYSAAPARPAGAV